MCGFEGTYLFGPVAQLVRAPPCHGGGRGFESHPGRLSARIYLISEYGILAQLGEHLPYKQRVIGSSPIGPIYADVAQLAEQLICNQQVNGSSPFIGLLWLLKVIIKYGWIPEWPKGTDCKSAANCFGGSNPPPPI